jgi:hypothetical protein
MIARLPRDRPRVGVWGGSWKLISIVEVSNPHDKTQANEIHEARPPPQTVPTDEQVKEEEKDGKKPKKEENQKGESPEKQLAQKIPKEDRLGHGNSPPCGQ